MSFSVKSMEQVEVETLFVNVEIESSEEPPMDEWSSLPSHESVADLPKYTAYKQGKYDPGTGEICAEYVITSDSSVRRHVYYQYPRVQDPGIVQALTYPEPRRVYNDDGQELYLDLCEEMNLMPIRKFHRSLVQREINLRYYGVSPAAIRAMSLSMTLNRVVKRLDLTSNFLTNDACYHLGQLLKDNHVLDELVLAQCRIGPYGLLRIIQHLSTRSMEVLDVSSNALQDEGFEHLANVMANGCIIKRLNVSHNSLGPSSTKLLTQVLDGKNQVTHLNLSWNQLYDTKSCDRLMRVLRQSKFLVELDLSWNSLTISGGRLQNLVRAKNLAVLNLSNNRLGKASAKSLAKGLLKAKKLRTLDLSYNPLWPNDALILLTTLIDKNCGLENLLMAGVVVSKEFREALEEIKALSFRTGLNVVYERVERDYELSAPKLRPIVLKRLDFMFARSSKKCNVDIGLYFMNEYKMHPKQDFLMENEFIRFMKSKGLKPDVDMLEHLLNLFPGPTLEKTGRTLRLSTLIEYINRLWPEKKLPPTPPMTPLPPTPKGKKKKAGKSGKPKK